MRFCRSLSSDSLKVLIRIAGDRGHRGAQRIRVQEPQQKMPKQKAPKQKAPKQKTPKQKTPVRRQRHRRRPADDFASFATYFRRVLKRVHTGLSLSQEAVSVMDSIGDPYISVPAAAGEIGEYAISEGTKAVIRSIEECPVRAAQAPGPGSDNGGLAVCEP
ncbi:Histone H2B type W-T [Camelus dromedarius]|uniref:Histone H2B type W-T n=1 Tax=Camelus dromedarius TaxID=9838 RepID=A0A5N4C3C1_CAMDR|nr:Histone H2B type W-T [Camelus dromedarius]